LKEIGKNLIKAPQQKLTSLPQGTANEAFKEEKILVIFNLFLLR
jgi:hypothetical protein